MFGKIPQEMDKPSKELTGLQTEFRGHMAIPEMLGFAVQENKIVSHS